MATPCYRKNDTVNRPSPHIASCAAWYSKENTRRSDGTCSSMRSTHTYTRPFSSLGISLDRSSFTRTSPTAPSPSNSSNRQQPTTPSPALPTPKVLSTKAVKKAEILAEKAMKKAFTGTGWGGTLSTGSRRAGGAVRPVSPSVPPPLPSPFH
ncbi:hypothetical protein JCM10213_001463 [Rhodosporidiobolus nylandii]